MGTGASWYETGYEGAEREQQKSELGWPPQRLWLKPGTRAELRLTHASNEVKAGRRPREAVDDRLTLTCRLTKSRLAED